MMMKVHVVLLWLHLVAKFSLRIIVTTILENSLRLTLEYFPSITRIKSVLSPQTTYYWGGLKYLLNYMWIWKISN